MPMPKQENSLRSQGLTYIPTDKPTRAKLRALAEAARMPLSEYLRVIAEGQGSLPGISPGGRAEDLEQEAEDLLGELQMGALNKRIFRSAISRNVKAGNIQLARRLVNELNALLVKQLLLEETKREGLQVLQGDLGLETA